jgi:hypothetical protein
VNSTAGTRRRPRLGAKIRRAGLALACVAALACLGLSWSLASPIGASPDDDFHLASIWCLAGDRDLCRRTGETVEEGVERVLVPPELGPGITCYALQPTVSAGCQAEYLREDGLRAGRANDGLYPEGWYRLMSPFASANVEFSVVLMRMVSWLLALSLLVGALALASSTLRWQFGLALITTLVPLGVFLFASTNPSGIAIAGVASYWCAATMFMNASRLRDRRGLGVTALLLMSAALVLAARTDGGLFLAVTSLVVLISAGGHRLRAARRPALLAGVSIVGLLAVAAGTQSQRWAEGLGVEPENSLAASVFESLLELPNRVFGVGPLGWLDTPMPALVSVLMLLSIGGTLLIGIGVATRAKWLAVGIAAGAIVVLTTVVLVSGQNVQPRYVLPLVPVLVATSLSGSFGVALSRGQTFVLVGMVVVAHSAALHRTIRRFVSGIDVGGPDLGESVEWWWSAGPGPMVTWVVGSIAFTFVATLLALLVIRDVETGSPPLQRVEAGVASRRAAR